MTSPSNTPAGPSLVWDLPVRVFHWLLVFSFFGAYLTAESERWRLVHVTLGYTVGGLIAFRLLWGLLGTRHARFSSFVRGPAAVQRYLRSLLTRQPEHHTGHNPAGALAVLGLLALGLGAAFSGWAVYEDWGGHLVEELHEGVANTLLALVALHVLGVVASSWLHHENLVRAMLTGRKPVPAAEGITRSWRVLGALVLATVLGFWALQWQRAAQAPGGSAGQEARAAGPGAQPGAGKLAQRERRDRRDRHERGAGHDGDHNHD